MMQSVHLSKKEATQIISISRTRIHGQTRISYIPSVEVCMSAQMSWKWPRPILGGGSVMIYELMKVLCSKHHSYHPIFPIENPGTIEEVINSVTYLSSNDSSYTTGTHLVNDQQFEGVLIHNSVYLTITGCLLEMAILNTLTNIKY
ncbi:hypothetical protein ACHAW6_013382 [Cyclotella cf. meneghiniana]